MRVAVHVRVQPEVRLRSGPALRLAAWRTRPRADRLGEPATGLPADGPVAAEAVLTLFAAR
jgi:hypothetical protein